MKNRACLMAGVLLVTGILTGCISYETIRVGETSEETTTSATTVSMTSVDVTTETTTETYEFHAGVTTMEAHRLGLDGSDVLLFSEEYDDVGNVVKRTDYKNGTIDSTTQNAYDNEGKIQVSQKDVSGFFYGTVFYSYQYDESGNLLKESFTAHYDCSDTTQPSYDSEGYTEYVYENGLPVKVFKSQTDYEADTYTMTSHEEYKYDEQGQLIKTTVYSSGTNTEETLECEIFFEYDEEGRLIKKTASYEGESDKEEIYEYDGAGNLVKTISEDGTVVSTYDENGRKIKDSYEVSGEAYDVEYRWE
ncbi:MAG: RHS repeat protein [Clostridiales bacterium]|nr:RHS repeat protein [Clostridiales bacterium]